MIETLLRPERVGSRLDGERALRQRREIREVAGVPAADRAIQVWRVIPIVLNIDTVGRSDEPSKPPGDFANFRRDPPKL
jgi:hypothetical protein